MFIINGKILTMEGKTLECGYVHTKGKFIEEVGDMSAFNNEDVTEGHLIADDIKASGFPVISGTTLTSRSKLEVQNKNFNTCKILHEKGILFSVTTDHPVALIQYLPAIRWIFLQKLYIP